MSTIDLNRHTKLGELLKAFPHLEEELKQLSPVYKNLENPILRKTVLKIATLEKVAAVGKLDVYYLVNTLRNKVGMAPLTPETEEETETAAPVSGNMPDWITGQPAKVIDGVAMLNRGEHPLGAVMQSMQELAKGQYLLLKTNFKPEPLIEKMQEAGYRVHHQIDEQQGQSHWTFVGK